MLLVARIHKLINSIGNKEKMSEEWKESITVPVYKKDDTTDCSNYRFIPPLTTTYKMLPNILLSRLTPHAEEMWRDHHCGFRRSRSATDHTFCIRQIVEKKLEHKTTAHQLIFMVTPCINDISPFLVQLMHLYSLLKQD